MDEFAAVAFDLDDTLCVHDQDGDALLARTFDRAGVEPLFHLATPGIARAFDAAVYCDTGTGVEPKPNPGALRMTVDELSVIPSDAVTVGDDHAADVVGAHAVGTHSAWVPLDEAATDHDPAPTYIFDGMHNVVAPLGE